MRGCLEPRAAVRDLLVQGGYTPVTVENKYLSRKEVEPVNGRLSLFVDEEPLTLIGLDGELREDRSLVIEVPQWTEPGKPVSAKIILQNIGPGENAWTCSSCRPALGTFARNRQAGPQRRPAGRPAGAAAARRASRAGRLLAAGDRHGRHGQDRSGEVFRRRYSLVLKHVLHTPRLDGKFLPWLDTPPSGRADTKEQVVAGAENCGGPTTSRPTSGWPGGRSGNCTSPST